MFDIAVLTKVEDTQSAKDTGSGKLASDQAKAAAVAATITQDTTDQAALDTAADVAIDAALTMLTGLRSHPAPAV